MDSTLTRTEARPPASYDSLGPGVPSPHWSPLTTPRSCEAAPGSPEASPVPPVTPGEVVTPRGLTTVMAPALVLLATGVM